MLVFFVVFWGFYLLLHHYQVRWQRCTNNRPMHAQSTMRSNTTTRLQSIVRLRQQHFFIGGENYNPWVQQFLSTDGEAPTPVGTTPREKTVIGKTKRLVKRMGTLIMPKDVRRLVVVPLHHRSNIVHCANNGWQQKTCLQHAYTPTCALPLSHSLKTHTHG